MLLVTRSAGTILDDVRFVEHVPLMTRLTFAIDRLKSEAVMKSVAHNRRQFFSRGGFVMTGRAIVGKPAVRCGNFPGIKKCFATTQLENGDGDDAADERDQAHERARPSPRMQFSVITEIGLVTLGDLFLRATRRGHASKML